MEAHNAAVATISERVKQFYARKEPFRFYHGSTNSTRQSTRNRDNTIDTSALNSVLSVDPAAKIALVEPNVPMDALLAATLPKGFVVPVVMEFPGITVGGGFSGTSGESSSFRHGAFDTTVNAIEIVLADGRVARASKNEKKDLFWGAASAFGTLGVVTLLEIQLIEARPYVQLEYHCFNSFQDAIELMKSECKREDNDFVDGIVYAKDSTVLCSGRMVDETEIPKGNKMQHFHRRGDPWFYLQVEKVTEKLKSKGNKKACIEYMPLTDYLFRWDRGGFFTARYAFRYFLTPFNRITRYLLDSLLRTRVMYRALHKSGLSDFYLVQDVGVPFDRAVEFQEWLDKSFNIYPLWLCPLRVKREDPDSAYGLHAEFANPTTTSLLNFGVWGPLPGDRKAVIARNRDMEKKVDELGGKKWLYAQAFYTEDEFWKVYDKTSYDELRAKYSATHLPSVYDKVKVDYEKEEAVARANGLRRPWPLPGLKGVYKALRGGDYLMQKGTRKTANTTK